MDDAQQTAGYTRSLARRPGRARLDTQVHWTLEALSVPVAVLDSNARVLGVNAAWREVAALSDRGTAACDPGDNYLKVCTAAFGRVTGATKLHAGLSRVLAGLQPSFEQACRRTGDDAPRDFRVRISRIEHEQPPHFLVTHEEITAIVEAQQIVREVGERISAAQTEERERLAEELHDSVGQNLVCLGLGLSRLRLVTKNDEAIGHILSDMAESLEDAHAQVRTISYLLHPPWPEKQGALEAAVRQFVQGFGRRAGLTVEVTQSGPACTLDRSRELTLFRILQEALVNVHRHADAHAVTVELVNEGGEVTLEVADDGKGFAQADGAAPPAGVGIQGMRARVTQFGGDLRVITSPTGTVVRARLPASRRLRIRHP